MKDRVLATAAGAGTETIETPEATPAVAPETTPSTTEAPITPETTPDEPIAARSVTLNVLIEDPKPEVRRVSDKLHGIQRQMEEIRYAIHQMLGRRDFKVNEGQQTFFLQFIKSTYLTEQMAEQGLGIMAGNLVVDEDGETV